MSLLDVVTGGKSGEASADEQRALEALQNIQTPNAAALTLPELQKYAVSQNMTPAQMQAFLQQANALNAPVGQTGTSAQEQAIGQLANVANAGAAGTPLQQAQEAQINQNAARNLAGQRGAIDQQAEERGVAPGMLQAALGQNEAGQGLQDAHMAALQSQGENYQQALQALASEGAAGQALQGQQNTQANTVGAAQNAMQQFNAANQQQAAGQNAGYQQQANATNTQNANQTGQANTGLANQRTTYNAQVPENVFKNQLEKATGVAGANQQAANTATGQGQQQAGLIGGLLGTAGTVAGGMYGGPVGAAVGGAAGKAVGNEAGSNNGYAAQGMLVPSEEGCAYGGMPMKQGGLIPGHARVPGNSQINDTVPIKVSPGEAVIPRTAVQQNPIQTMQLLRGGHPPVAQPGQQPHHPQDIAALLAAMKHMRGGQ
jgi:hypothetical protein